MLGVDTNPKSSQIWQLLEKAIVIVNQWQNRSVTLWGKVTILNSLVSSLFVYILQCIECPGEKFYEMYDKCIVDFLWAKTKGRRGISKIPLSVLKQKCSNGGMKLVDLKSKAKTLRISWLFRDSQYVCNLLDKCTPPEFMSLFWKCSLHPTDVEFFLARWTPRFWVQVICDWFSLTWEYPVGAVEQIIWCNSHIKAAGKPLLYSKCCKSGLVFVRDLFHNNALMTFDVIKEMYDITWWQYNTIIAAVPSKWFEEIRMSKISEEHLYDILKIKQKPSKVIYDFILQTVPSDIDKVFGKIVSRYMVSKEQWLKAVTGVMSNTNIVKYRNFQYKLLMNAVPANDRLFYWKKVDSQGCERCNCIKQTTRHLLFECPIATKIWEQFQFFVRNCIEYNSDEISYSFQVEDLFLGSVVANPRHIVNFLVLVTKQYLYATKFTKKWVSFKTLLHLFDELQGIERYNALKANSLSKHFNKWVHYNPRCGNSDRNARAYLDHIPDR